MQHNEATYSERVERRTGEVPDAKHAFVGLQLELLVKGSGGGCVAARRMVTRRPKVSCTRRR